MTWKVASMVVTWWMVSFFNNASAMYSLQIEHAQIDVGTFLLGDSCESPYTVEPVLKVTCVSRPPAYKA